MSANLRLLVIAAVAAVIAFTVGLLAGRGSTGHAMAFDLRHNPDGKGTPVATFDDDSISREELEERFAEMAPQARARYQTVPQRREYLDGLARFELLAAEARDRGLGKDKEVREAARKMMVQQLLKRELEDDPTPPTDAELAEYFERHRSDYVRPEMVRMSHLFLAAPRTNPELVARQRKKLEALLAEAKQQAPQDFRAFGTLVIKNSEEPRTRPLEGDMRFLSAAELEAQYGKEVAAAAAELKDPGQLSGIVQTDQGLHLLKLRSREAAVNHTVETVRPQLTARLGYERRTQRYDAFLESLTKKWNLKIDEAQLAAVKVDPTSPARPTMTSPPGFIPPPSRGAGGNP